MCRVDESIQSVTKSHLWVAWLVPAAYVALNISILDSRETLSTFAWSSAEQKVQTHTDSILTTLVEERWLPYTLHSYRHAYIINLTYRLCPGATCFACRLSHPLASSVRNQILFIPPQGETSHCYVEHSAPNQSDQLLWVCAPSHEPACTVCVPLFMKNNLFYQT